MDSLSKQTTARTTLEQPTSTRRVDRAALELARQQLTLNRLLTTMLEAIPDYAMVLNEELQVITANKRFVDHFSASDLDSLMGRRPGEAFGCTYPGEGSGGCGANPHCATCGAVLTIRESLRTRISQSAECRVTLARQEGALDVELVSTPTTIGNVPVIICVMRDISAEKRRSVLERVFFHDVLNTAGGIRGIAGLLASDQAIPLDQQAEYRQKMAELSERLVEEITHQQKLVAAEEGNFKPDLGMVRVADLLHEIHWLYSHHVVAQGRELVLGSVPEATIISDGKILGRIIGNLVKNALEATAEGGTVTMGAEEEGNEITFRVNNPGVMPVDVQLQLFQRSFSTKAESGRGIGTYSIKLFGERYLRGRISFASSEPDGTTFSFTIPKLLES